MSMIKDTETKIELFDENDTEKSRYATKKKGKTEVYPFWNMEDMKAMIDWFIVHEEWDGYLTFMLGLLMGRRIGDTLSIKWSDFYYENGNRKTEINTIEEQKTGKITTIYISEEVWNSIDFYLEKTNKNPKELLDKYIFQYEQREKWLNRREDDIYNPVAKPYSIMPTMEWLDKYCELLNKDFSNARKNKIITAFHKQKRYSYIGQYMYYEIEYMDIIKWQEDAFRRKFDKAAKDCKIKYRVSTHSLRKSWGMWIMKEHPYDPDCIYSLQRLLNHSDVQTTMNYIGLSSEKDRKYMTDHGEFINKVANGKFENAIGTSSPVVSLKTDDLRTILLDIISNKNDSNNALSDVEIFNIAMNRTDELRIH